MHHAAGPMSSARLDSLSDAMRAASIDLCIATPSADMEYLLGRRGHESERPNLLAVSPGAMPVLLVAELEAPGFAHLDTIETVTYNEYQDPFAVFADALGHGTSSDRVAISDVARASVLLRLQSTFADTVFVPASPLMARLRVRKSPEEVARLERAGAMADAAFQRFIQLPFAGRTEAELARELSALLAQEGLERADWGPIVASGPNSASPHHGAGTRELQEGDSLVLDFGGVFESYQADMTRTVHVGTPGDEFVQVHETVRRAQQAAVAAIKPGTTAWSVDAAARQVIGEAGYGNFFIHRTGHGLGLETHEEPYIISGNDLELRPGMVFSVEPGIYLPGKFGVRIEDIVVVTEDGAKRLNTSRRDLVVVH